MEHKLTMEYRKLSSLKMSVHNDQVFRNLSPEETLELADSIKANGLINPISIKPNGTIIAGHQRYRAAQHAGLKEIPVIVHDIGDREAFRLWLSENIHRRNLSTRETILANCLMVLDKVAELRGVEFSNVRPLGGGELEKLTEGELTQAIAALIAGGETRHKKTQLQNHVLIASGLIEDLQELVFSGELTQKVGAACAGLEKEDQKDIAKRVKAGVLAASEIDNAQREIKALNSLNKQLERENRRLLKRLDEIAESENAAVEAKTESMRIKHEREIEQLRGEKAEVEGRIEMITKRAEILATKAKYDKLLSSVLLLDSLASRGTAREAMSERVQFGVFDDAFILMMENVSTFLADCVKEVRKKAFQDRAKASVLQLIG